MWWDCITREGGFGEARGSKGRIWGWQEGEGLT
jgi:hypothetical protein